MAANQPPWPREWLMTDERIGDRLWEAIKAMPSGGGVVFRHYRTRKNKRDALAQRVAALCDDRQLALSVAGDVELATSVGASMVHNPDREPGSLPFSRSAHSADEAEVACASGASLLFLSTIFPTRSHPESPPLPRGQARRIVSACPVPVIALGGMNRARFEELRSDGFYGWAGIDAWLGEQTKI